jgi:hypothetical protein
MRKACWIWLVAVSLGSAGIARAEEKATIPAGATTLDDLKQQAGRQQMTRTAPRHMSQSRSGVGNFFRKLFGPSDPKINGTVIGGAQTYKNGIMPVAPIAPR